MSRVSIFAAHQGKSSLVMLEVSYFTSIAGRETRDRCERGANSREDGLDVEEKGYCASRGS